MRIRVISRFEVDAFPACIWNAFLDLLATEDYLELTPLQRIAQLAFIYDGEVQNGGHFQYFENRGTEYLNETLDALGVLGANLEQQILSEASQEWMARPRPLIESAKEFCEVALAGEFEAFDSRFYGCSPSLSDRLNEYLMQNQSSFVLIR